MTKISKVKLVVFTILKKGLISLLLSLVMCFGTWKTSDLTVTIESELGVIDPEVYECNLDVSVTTSMFVLVGIEGLYSTWIPLRKGVE